MTCERSRSDRQDWVRLPEHYSQILRWYLVTQLIHMHIDLLLNSSKRCGRTPRNGARRSTSRGNSGIFARPGHKSEGRILLPATAPMNHLSSCSEGTKATCSRNCICVNSVLTSVPIPIYQICSFRTSSCECSRKLRMHTDYSPAPASGPLREWNWIR